VSRGFTGRVARIRRAGTERGWGREGSGSYAGNDTGGLRDEGRGLREERA
jgi:hypothetical protein